MTARTDHEAGLSARVAALPTASQAALLKILARTATRAMESALALLEDLGMASPAVDSEPWTCAGPCHGPYIGGRPASGVCRECTRLAGVPDHTPEQDAADWQHGPAEDEHTAPGRPVALRAVPPGTITRGPCPPVIAACGRCGSPVAETGVTGEDGKPITRAQFCDPCIDRCHENSEFDHICQVCATPDEARARGWAVAR